MSSRSNASLLPAFVVVALGMVLGVAWCAANMGDGEDLKKPIESQGFTAVQIEGWAPVSCAKDDNIARHFTATNNQGKRVSGVLCCGLVLKSCTVRW